MAKQICEKILTQPCFEKNLPNEESGSPGIIPGQFIVDRIEKCCRYMTGISSFMGYADYQTAVENLERCGDQLFDKFEEWNRPKK